VSDAGEKAEGVIERSTVPVTKTHNRDTLNSYNETVQGAFESIRLLAKMQDKLAKRVRAGLHTVQVREGDIILAKGDRCEALYVVHEGEVGVFAQKSQGDRMADSDAGDDARAGAADMPAQPLDRFTMDESPDGSRASSALPTPCAHDKARDSAEFSVGNTAAGQPLLPERAPEAEVIGRHSAPIGVMGACSY
jgi:hypothetical protein